MRLLGSLPLRLRVRPAFNELESVVADIYAHRSMRLQGPALANMVLISLIFTICFYRNLVALLRHTIDRLASGMQLRSTELYLGLKLAEGELTDRVHPNARHDKFGPHYVLMRRAAKRFGIDVRPVERFVRLLNEGQPAAEAASNVGFCDALVEYFRYSDLCRQDYLSSLATIAGREHVLAWTFERMARHLPRQRRLERFRDFLTLHIYADKQQPKESHERLTTGRLRRLNEQELDAVLAVMIQFFRLRLAVYEACLVAGGLFK